MKLRTCVTAQGKFQYGVHKPSYRVKNLRQKEHILSLGTLSDGSQVQNKTNFPKDDLNVEQASTVYEIPNAFDFRGSTFIDSSMADTRAKNLASIRITHSNNVSMQESLKSWAQNEKISIEAKKNLFNFLPTPILLALATTSTDKDDLIHLAQLACEFNYSAKEQESIELKYRLDEHKRPEPAIHDRDLFEAVANNPNLPDKYKEAMLLRPGVQGTSEIVGDYTDDTNRTHIFEYLRRNSYIPWGHYAANMAHDAVRYRIKDLSWADMRGLRHLYYQRIFVRLAQELNLEVPKNTMCEDELETLRQQICTEIQHKENNLHFTASLWGWNYGFDFAPTRYKLHGSHQQIHHQNAMIPTKVQVMDNGMLTDKEMDSFACGDMIAEVAKRYHQETGQDFFEDLISCIRSNQRTDGLKGQDSLIVYEDENVLLFVPKAQLSQWELQLITLPPVGNILEANTNCRASLDRAMLLALRILEEMGAKMVTSIEYCKRFTNQESSQRLIYSFLPKLPWSPGSFSEAQQRYICGHYPEDFAAACRIKLSEIIQHL